jgi:hypothetical protein
MPSSVKFIWSSMSKGGMVSLTIGQVNVYEYGLVGRTLAPSSILVTYDGLARGWGSAYDRKVYQWIIFCTP